MVCSFGMPYYVVNHFTLSHVFEFFSIAMVFWSSLRLYSSNGKFRYLLIIVIPFSMALTYLVRPADVNVFLLPFIVWLVMRIVSNDYRKPLHNKKEILCFILSVCISIVFLIIINNKLYNVCFPSFSDMYGYSDPKIPTELFKKINLIFTNINFFPLILFSSELGILYSAPIFLFGLICLLIWILTKKITYVSILLLFMLFIFFSIPFSIVLLWKTTASSFGYRYLFSIAPVCILGFVIWFTNAGQFLRNFILKLLILFSIFSILCQIFYATDRSLSPRPQVNSFGVYHRFSVNHYVPELVKAILSTSGWARVFIQRFPGFTAALLIDQHKAVRIASNLALSENNVNLYYKRLRNTNDHIISAIIVYAFFFPIVLWFMVFVQKPHSRSYKNTIRTL